MRMCMNTIVFFGLAPCPPYKSDPVTNPKAANYSTANFDVLCTDSTSFLSGPTDNVAHEVILYIWYKVQRTRYLFVPGTTHLLIQVV